ncbi:hypothetical protein FA15DRAFT_620586 [Coprinopsis marcescibilis]|uniref:F-box domain-containing protein n=1 Tax=Coprinopsis marcescibilis TaxID=230819 RepID=A0A5C3KT57_COPMA|nr:hypothetical protein FA15DRAFT_620586 [Coprinopsis marcescibilis]
MEDNSSGSIVVDLPNEILSYIVGLAAQATLKNCYNLCLASHAFKIWSEQFLYDRVDCMTHKSTASFCGVLLRKPPNFFLREGHVKSISFAEIVPLPLARSMLTRCSARLLSYSALSIDPEIHPARNLDFVKSPFIRRLCLIWSPGNSGHMQNALQGQGAVRWLLTGRASPYNCIPPPLFSTVTHFIGYTPGTVSFPYMNLLWGCLEEAVEHYDKVTGNPPVHYNTLSRRRVWQSFQSLTHLAMSTRNLNFVMELAKVAGSLKFIALLHHEGLKVLVGHTNEQWEDIKTYPKLLGPSCGRRFVIMDKRKIGNLDLVDSGEQRLFWERVEELILQGFWTDSGDRWDELEVVEDVSGLNGLAPLY